MASAGEAWVIRVSSTVRIGARREGEFGHEGKRVNRVVTRVDEDESEVTRSGERRTSRGRGYTSNLLVYPSCELYYIAKLAVLLYGHLSLYCGITCTYICSASPIP